MTPRPRSRRRRILLFLAGALILILALFLGSVLLLRYQGQRDLEAAIAGTDRLDPNWRLEDIEASRGPIPVPEQNGFAQIERLIAEWSAGSPLMRPKLLPQIKDARNRFGSALLSDGEAKHLRPQIESSKNQLSRVRKLAAMPPGRGASIIPKDGEPYAPTPQVLGFLELANGVCTEARLRIFDGDTAGAFQDCLAALQLRRTLAAEPHLFAQIVGNAIDIVGCNLIEQLLSTGKCSSDQLAKLQEFLEVELATPRVLLGIRTDRARSDWGLANIQNGEISTDKLRAVFDLQVAGLGIAARVKQQLHYSLLMSNLAGQRAQRMREANELIAVSQLPYAQRFQGLEKYVEKRRLQSASKFGWLGTYPDPEESWALYLREQLMVDAVLSSTIVAIATERYRLKHKHWPKTMNDLSPGYLAVLPVDPFTGEPLHFIRKGPVLVIYSIGENLADDGGELANRFVPKGMDIGFVLLDPDQLRHAEAAQSWLSRTQLALTESAMKMRRLFVEP